jgi:hypothetical protein
MTESEGSTPAEAGDGETGEQAAPKKTDQVTPKKGRSVGPVLRLIAVAFVALAVIAAGWSYLGDRAQPVLPALGSAETGAPAPAPVSTRWPYGLTAVEQRLALLEARPDPSAAEGPVAEQAVGALAARIAQIEGALAEQPQGSDTGPLAARIAGLERRVGRLEDQGASTPADGFRATSLAFALGQLGDGISVGRPFGPDLDRVAALAAGVPGGREPGGPADRITTAVGELRGYAADGAPTLADLRRDFGAVARAVLKAGAGPADGDWTDSLRSRLASVVVVRRTGELAGETPEARVARAEIRINGGDLPAAVDELSALGPGPSEAAASWLADARAHLAAERALRAMEAAVGDAVADPGGSNGGAG